MNKKCVAIVCCRGGSKGIPGKNIKLFHGKPLLGWILDEAKKSGVFDQIVLSTDSQQIADVGISFGAEVPVLRPAELATDSACQFDSFAHMFEVLKMSDETHFVCNLNNNPFINSELISESHQTFVDNQGKYIVLDTTEVPGDFMSFRQAFELDNRLQFQFPRDFYNSGINRQSYGRTYTAINNIRWGKPSYLNSYNAFKEQLVTNGFLPAWLPKTRNFDLDDQYDWDIAEAVMGKLFI